MENDHPISDLPFVHESLDNAFETMATKDMAKELSGKTEGLPEGMKLILEELQKELVFLGMNEGNVTECRDPEAGGLGGEVEFRGVIRKRIKQGLVMEYNFFSPGNSVKNFHLNNVEINLADIEENKLIKLVIIVKFFNEKYRKSSNGRAGAENDEEDFNAKQRRKIELAEERKRKLVLGKL